VPYDEIVESSAPILSLSSPSYVADISSWPYPRIISTRYRIIAFIPRNNGNLYCYEMALAPQGLWNGTSVGSLGAIADIAQLNIADFGPFYVISLMNSNNSIVRTYMRDPSAIISTTLDPLENQLIIPSTEPAFVCCCNFNGQLVGGNIYAPSNETTNYWSALGTNCILWSGIGSSEFNPAIDPTAGFRELITSYASGKKATIYSTLPLQEGVICYTDHGIVALVNDTVQNIATYGLVPLKSLGIASGNHVAGDNYIHGFIDLNCDFWTLENTSFRLLDQQGGKLTKRGYRDVIAALFATSSPVIVSYLPRDNSFYISNGLKSLVINRFGAGLVHQAVSGLFEGYDKKLYGTFFDSGDLQGRITLESVDFNARGIKSLEALLAGISCASSTAVTYATDYRMSKNSSFKRSLSKRGGPRAEARIGVSALEFRPNITFSSYVESELEYLRANVKFPDGRFRRGLSMAAQGTEG